MSGYVEVEAETLEKAIDKFNPLEHDLPPNEESEYVDGSFRLTSNDLEEVEDMIPKPTLVPGLPPAGSC